MWFPRWLCFHLHKSLGNLGSRSPCKILIAVVHNIIIGNLYRLAVIQQSHLQLVVLPGGINSIADIMLVVQADCDNIMPGLRPVLPADQSIRYYRRGEASDGKLWLKHIRSAIRLRLFHTYI